VAPAPRALGRQLEVEAELVFEIAIGTAPPERSPQANDPFAKSGHAGLSVRYANEEPAVPLERQIGEQERRHETSR
jgi:hypothetical protein